MSEDSASTAVDGSYEFTSLALTTQHVAIAPPHGWREISPAPGRLFKVLVGGSAVYEIDPTTGAQLSQISPLFAPGAVSIGAALGRGSLFFVQSFSAGSPAVLSEFNPDSGVPMRNHSSIPTTATIGGLAFLDGLLYVDVPTTHQIIAFDPTTDSVVRTLTVAANIGGGVCGASDMGVLFATNGNKIEVIDPISGAVIRTLTVGLPTSLLPGLAYVKGEIIATDLLNAATAFRIDPQTGVILGQFPWGAGQFDALAADGSAQRTVDLSASDATDVDFGALAVSAPTSVPDLLPTSDTGTYNFDNITTLVSGSTTFRVYNTVPGATVILYNGIATTAYNPWGTAVATGNTTDVTMIVPSGWGPLGSSSYPFTVIQTEQGKLPSRFPPGGALWVGPSAHNAIPPDLLDSSDMGTSFTDNITNDNTPTFAGAANDGEIVRLYDSGVEVGSATAANGAYAVTASPRIDGTHSMTVKLFSNSLQYSVSDAMSVTIRTVAPSVSASSFAYNNSKPGAVVSFAITDATSRVWGSLTLDDFQLANLDTGMPLEPSKLSFVYSTANVSTIAFPGYPQGILPDGDYHLTLLAAGVSDTAGNPLPTDYGFDFFVFSADANRDRSVDTIDFNILAANFSQSGRTFSQGNFDYSAGGTVDTIDFNLFAVQFGKNLPGSGTRSSSRYLLAPAPPPAAGRFSTQFVESSAKHESIDEIGIL
jgi:hypothetical protein